VTVTEAELRAAAGDDPGAGEIAGLWLKAQADVTAAFAVTDWAEDEITQAQKRHPAKADLLYHAFPALQPGEGFTFPRTVEFVWRGHYRELLERVAAGQDTRPATYAEICLLMSAASERAPLTTDAFGLYVRAWCTAFPGADIGIGALRDELDHYERMNGTGMDDLERQARAAVGRRSGWRKYPPNDLTCTGMHHGEPAPRRRPAPPPGAAALQASLLDNPAGDGLAAEIAALIAEVGTTEGGTHR
jgi:hypothetical protein